jgi:hypothetical protein
MEASAGFSRQREQPAEASSPEDGLNIHSKLGTVARGPEALADLTLMLA